MCRVLATVFVLVELDYGPFAISFRADIFSSGWVLRFQKTTEHFRFGGVCERAFALERRWRG